MFVLAFAHCPVLEVFARVLLRQTSCGARTPRARRLLANPNDDTGDQTSVPVGDARLVVRQHDKRPEKAAGQRAGGGRQGVPVRYPRPATVRG